MDTMIRAACIEPSLSSRSATDALDDLHLGAAGVDKRHRLDSLLACDVDA
jgi:hypothetical protein